MRNHQQGTAFRPEEGGLNDQQKSIQREKGSVIWRFAMSSVTTTTRPSVSEGTETLILRVPHIPEDVSAWLIGLSAVPAIWVPPKHPHDDDNENGEDEEDDDDNDEEPAVIREPDEC
jgi:hypothetical protein